MIRSSDDAEKQTPPQSGPWSETRQNVSYFVYTCTCKHGQGLLRNVREGRDLTGDQRNHGLILGRWIMQIMQASGSC